MAYSMDPYDKRVELPSVQEVFYGPREPTYFVGGGDPYYNYQRRPRMVAPPPAYYPRDVVDPVYRTRALVAPSATQTHVVPVNSSVDMLAKVHPKGLILSVPMCCDKCVEKVRKALDDLEGLRELELDQYNQLVTIHGDVDPEKALRRVRRVKKRSRFWRMSTQPLQYSGSPTLSSKSLVNAYRAPGYYTSAYRAPSSAYSSYLSPPRYTSSYSRVYSSPYIDSAYRSGYVEPRGFYPWSIPAYGRSFARDDMDYYSRFDRGTPYLQLNDF